MHQQVRLQSAQSEELVTKKAFKTRRKPRISSPWLVNLMYLPALLLLAVFIFYPFVQGVRYSFTNWDGYSEHFRWIGLLQYQRFLSDPDMLRTIVNTFIYGCGSTLLQNILGLAYALFLDQNIRGKGLVRTIVYMPIIISPLIMGYISYFFFQYDGGAANDVLHLLGRAPVDWLGNGPTAVWIITFVNTYQYMGVAMIIYLAGLQAIPREYQDAAAIDGASALARFRFITLPLLMPAITVSIVYNVIGGLKLFDVIVAMTNGGPGYASQSLSTMMYNLYFAREDAGYAATLGNIMFLIITVVGVALLVALRRKEVRL
ncbi:MAG TPA: sugar ABC transporter permease [Ktedonobacteraceae bacterium]|nr:sugar ABC transporter permease [Ktedonobacteraceae bacterium]